MKHIYKALAIVLALGAMVSCEKWEKFNTDPFGVSSEMLEADYNNIGAYYPKIMQSVYLHYGTCTSRFQMTNNLTADIWSGYMAFPSCFASNQNTGFLVLPDGYCKRQWVMTYDYVMSTIFNYIKPQADTDKYRYLFAPALIVQVYAMMRVTDSYGPIIYTQYGASSSGGAYDKQKDTYDAFFRDLDTAIETLDAFVTEYPDSRPFTKFDCWYNGDYHKWIKLANTLRIRLAMHIVKVDPVTAKTQAEKAVANKYGLLSTKDDICTVGGDGWSHPLAIIAHDWEDTSMSALMESFLLGYNDPRIGKFFDKTTEPAALAKGYEYKGIRLGIPELTSEKLYKHHSTVNVQKSDRAVLMTSAEAYFLLAEGALRGWNMGGTAKEFYEKGVAASFEQWDCSGAEAYLASTKVPTDYEDVLNPGNSIASVNHLCPKWDESASREEKLERIIDQKWIACFPEGHEAWTTQRRTGYPHLFPVKANYSSGIFKDDDNVKRMVYPSSEKNTEAYKAGVTYLNGPDNGNTRLWWDIEGPNF